MTQRQEFTVLRTYGDFEVREYKPCVIAEVKASGQYANTTRIAFRYLFNYISQGNKTSEKIAMTAPVIAAQRAERSDADEWFVSFVMPAGSNREHLPDPNDPNVHLRELPAETCVALSFRGKASEDLSAKKALELRAAAAKEKISLSEETRICRFDAPVKPGFLQYNEIVIPAYLDNSLI